MIESLIGAYGISLATAMAITVVFAISLNLITGYCGQISLGHAAFYGIGAYAAALLTKAGAPFLPAAVAGALVAGAVGIVVGFASLRVRHDFLAITTMGVGFLFIGVARKQAWLGGELGISGIPDPGLGKEGFLLLALATGAAAAALSHYLKRSWMGFAFDAIAEDEDTARVVGLDVAAYKLAAFALGTAIAGFAGALYAHNVRFVHPESFGFVESVTVLAMVVVGGIGSLPGVVVAAAVMSALPLWFQAIEDYKLLIYGLLLFAVMRFSPGGLAGLAAAAVARARAR